METFTDIKSFVDNPFFHEQRQECLKKLDINTIDEPIRDIVTDFIKLEYCFTLQCCYGHFLYPPLKDSHNVKPLPQLGGVDRVEYRIAYIAICIENSEHGMDLFKDLKAIQSIDTEFIQFGCAEWFWERQLNSYALQVEPKRYMNKDKIYIDYKEAIHIQEMKNSFFVEIRNLLKKRLERNG